MVGADVVVQVTAVVVVTNKECPINIMANNDAI